MSLRINNDVKALAILRNLGLAQTAGDRAIGRLSSGFRISRAADDAAGLAIANQLRAEVGSFFLPGLGLFVAILLHKPLDALSIETMMRLDGWSERHRGIANTLFALLCPIAAIVFYLGFSGPIASVLPAALAFSAGAFICIALADLLPEVQSIHSGDEVDF